VFKPPWRCALVSRAERTVVVGNGDCTDGPSPSFGGSGSFSLGVTNARDS
jgi:hypothetical protein